MAERNRLLERERERDRAAALQREEDQRRLTRAALVHDVGKAFVPVAILDKPGKLTPMVLPGTPKWKAPENLATSKERKQVAS